MGFRYFILRQLLKCQYLVWHNFDKLHKVTTYWRQKKHWTFKTNTVTLIFYKHFPQQWFPCSLWFYTWCQKLKSKTTITVTTWNIFTNIIFSHREWCTQQRTVTALLVCLQPSSSKSKKNINGKIPKKYLFRSFWLEIPGRRYALARQEGENFGGLWPMMSFQGILMFYVSKIKLYDVTRWPCWIIGRIFFNAKTVSEKRRNLNKHLKKHSGQHQSNSILKALKSDF